MTRNIIFSGITFALGIALFSFSAVLAHGEPTIVVEPAVAKPGDQITVTGADMEDGEMFTITVENSSGTFQIGEATAIQQGDEAGFTTTFDLPKDLTTGLYLLRAVTEEGESTAADLTIVSTVDTASSETMEASSMLHTLDRSKPVLLTGSVIAFAVLSASLGLWLLRRPG